MSLLKEAVNEQAFLKGGIFGFAGAGKSYTAMMLALGLSKELCSGRPIAAVETEDGTDFTLKYAQEEKIKVLRIKTRSFSELLEAAKEAEAANCCVLIVDSISHFWSGLLKAKLDAVNDARKKKGRYPYTKLPMPAIGEVKTIWEKWADFYRDSHLHIIACGRAGWSWTETQDEEGQDKLTKDGTKMKVEGEFAYEPSFMVEMIRESRDDKPGAGWLHKAVVIKDKSGLLNGKEFKFTKPDRKYKAGDYKRVFSQFYPAIAELNLGGNHVGVGSKQDPTDLFPGEDGESRAAEYARKMEIVLEEIQATITVIYPGQDQNSKQAKLAMLEGVFDTRAWAKVETKKFSDLEAGLRLLRHLEPELKANPSITPADLLAKIKTITSPVLTPEVAPKEVATDINPPTIG